MNRMKLLLLFIVGVVSIVSSQPLKYPVTARVDHVDNYFGKAVADPYRWLENDTSAAVAEWVATQNKVTFGYLKNIPFRENIKERLTKIWNYPKYSPPFREGTNYFFFKNDGLQNQDVMYIQRSLEADPEVFVDPNGLSVDGTVALSGFGFSKDGQYFAYGISRSGSDWREIFVMDVETKERLTDHVRWAKFTPISWYRNGFYYSRYNPPDDTARAFSAKNEFHRVYYHTLGTDQAEDQLVHEDRDHPHRTFGLTITQDERFAVLSASQGGSKGNAVFFRDLQIAESSLRPIIETFDDGFSLVGSSDGKLFFRTNRNAPNWRVIRIDPDSPAEANWVDILPERTDVLQSATIVGGKMIATYMKDVSHRVYVYSTAGVLENEIGLSTLGTASGFRGKHDDTVVFYSVTSFTSPSTTYKYDIENRQSSLYRKPEIDFKSDEYVTKQVFVKSKDGTRIPMFIVHKRGLTLNGNNPTLLYGYGGFNVSMVPSFNTSRLFWLEQGGVYAHANLRGGGEYGKKWHEAGMGLNKQNVFDDFIAAAEYLIAEQYTSPAKLAIQGGSNGGLLVGAVANQRPELFRVALPAVGVMDMLRFHKFTIGWAWVTDYGSSDDSVHFENLYRYSPIHNIREGIQYPATLVTTADHDDRVVPAHSFKYISTLQEKYMGVNPVLIRIETKAGHGAGKPVSKIISETADIYGFTLHNMGIIPSF